MSEAGPKLKDLATKKSPSPSREAVIAAIMERRDEILASRANGWTWKKIAESLRAEGIIVSHETLARRFNRTKPE